MFYPNNIITRNALQIPFDVLRYFIKDLGRLLLFGIIWGAFMCQLRIFIFRNAET